MRVPEFTDPDRRVLVSVDMESYSSRTNVLQHRAQSALKLIMEDATAEIGLNRIDWIIQQGGDGELGILPRGVSERVVVTRLAPAVDRLVRNHNQGLDSGAKVRLRIAVHQGLVHLEGANGFPGAAVVHISRLIDAPELKAILRRASGADVALIISDSLYQDVVRQYHDLRPEQFARIDAHLPEKNFQATAWVFVPGEDAAKLASATTEATIGTSGAGRATAAPVSAPTQSFSNITTHGAAAFGNHNTIDAGAFRNPTPDSGR
jgi:hypothetical protein